MPTTTHYAIVAVSAQGGFFSHLEGTWTNKAQAEFEQNYLTFHEPQRQEEAARAWNDWQDRCDEEAEHGEDYVVPTAPNSTVDKLAYILAPTLHRF